MMNHMDPSHAPRQMDKRAIAMKLRELADRLDAEADDSSVFVQYSKYETPGQVRRVNVATHSDWEQGNREVWLENGRTPHTTTWHIEIIRPEK